MTLELGSLLASMFSLWFGWKCLDWGDDRWDCRRRLTGGLLRCAGYLLGLSATFGLLVGLDLWSLLRLAWR